VVRSRKRHPTSLFAFAIDAQTDIKPFHSIRDDHSRWDLTEQGVRRRQKMSADCRLQRNLISMLTSLFLGTNLKAWVSPSPRESFPCHMKALPEPFLQYQTFPSPPLRFCNISITSTISCAMGTYKNFTGGPFLSLPSPAQVFRGNCRFIHRIQHQAQYYFITDSFKDIPYQVIL